MLIYFKRINLIYMMLTICRVIQINIIVINIYLKTLIIITLN